jgi:hypothetical protein
MELRNSLRLFRAVLITGTMMSVAAAGHVLGGGALPAPGAVAVLAVLLLVPVAWLAARELSFLTLLGVLGAGQLLLHGAFTSLSAPAVCLQSLTGQMRHHGQAMEMACSAAEPASMSLHLGTGSDSPLMLAGHGLALLVTAWLLRKGEAALWLLLAWLRPLVQLPRPSAVVPVRQRPMAAGRACVPSPWRNLRTDSLRGPPAAAARCAMP